MLQQIIFDNIKDTYYSHTDFKHNKFRSFSYLLTYLVMYAVNERNLISMKEV
jgi:hypothetical protein